MNSSGQDVIVDEINAIKTLCVTSVLDARGSHLSRFSVSVVISGLAVRSNCPTFGITDPVISSSV